MRGRTALAVAVVVGLGCTHQTETRSREVGAFTRDDAAAPAPPDRGAPETVASLEVDGRVVSGELAWSSRCRRRESRELVTTTTSRRVPDVASNLAWTVVGAGALLASGALVVHASGAPEGTRASEIPAGISLGAFGAGAAIGGLGGLFSTRGDNPHEQRDAVREDRVSDETVPCGDAAVPPSAELVLVLPGLAIPARPTGWGTFGFVLPERIDGAPARAEIVLAKGAREGERGAAIASVDLAGYEHYVAQHRPATWSGRAVGENVSFSTACVRGASSGCGGEDGDCDGFYDVGCGEHSGSLEWTLFWAGRRLTMSVTGPDGVEVSPAHPRGGASGVVIDVACGGTITRECKPPRINAYVPLTREPERGTYIVHVEPADGFPGPNEIVVGRLRGRIADRGFSARVTLRPDRGWQASLALAIGEDRDRDAVIDAEDACPDDAGPIGPRATNGCPREPAKRPKPR